MRRVWIGWLLMGCTVAEVTPPEDSGDSGETDVGGDSGSNETGWDTNLPDTGGAGGGGQDGGKKDPSVGATPYDGTWTGTFLFTDNQVFFGNKKDPKCAGTIAITVSGDKPDPRHLAFTGGCDTWDPNFDADLGNVIPGVPLPSISDPYGPMEVSGRGTFVDGDTTKAKVDITFNAPILGGVTMSGTASFEGTTFTFTKSTEQGIGQLKEGDVVEVTATLDTPQDTPKGSVRA